MGTHGRQKKTLRGLDDHIVGSWHRHGHLVEDGHGVDGAAGEGAPLERGEEPRPEPRLRRERSRPSPGLALRSKLVRSTATYHRSP